MASVSALSGGTTSRITDQDTEPNPARIPQKVLGQNDFLKLLATQFQAQDPMKPMEDTAFIAQMAQFSALEQSSAMAKELAVLRTGQEVTVANSYLGHRVTVDAGDSKTETGDVTAVDVSGDTPQLIVNGKPYSLSAVLRVEPSVLSASAQQPAPAGGA